MAVARSSMGSLSPQSMIQTAKSLPLLPAAYIVLSWPGPPYIPCKSTIGAATCAARSSSVLARSYIPHLRVFYRLICPSGWPLLQRSASTFLTMWTAPPRKHQRATDRDLPIPTTPIIYYRPSNSTRQTSSCSRKGFSSLGRHSPKKHASRRCCNVRLRTPLKTVSSKDRRS
jgi:hypothetical protein